MGYNNFLYLLNDALKNNHIELALASLKTFRAADIADLLTQLSIEHSQLLLIHLPERAYIFSYLSPTQQVKFAKAIPRNIFAEINSDFDSIFLPTNGNLERWAQQGILLLNASLTVKKDVANSHKHLKWNIFTDNVINYIANQKEHHHKKSFQEEYIDFLKKL